MSGSSDTISCPACRAVNNLRGKALTRALTCQSCGIYFYTGSWNPATVEFQHKESQALALGAKGRFDSFLYEVMGFVVKEEVKYHYRWREYMLFNPYRGYAFLSEYNGHWNFIWPIEEDPSRNSSDDSFTHDGSYYRLYQRYSASVVLAKGEFFFDVCDTTLNTSNYEYIDPPYVFAQEKSADSILWCKGVYTTPEDIASAFGIAQSALPQKSGIGYTQPFATSFRERSFFMFTLMLFLLISLLQLILNNAADDKVVFQSDFNKEQMKDQKLLVTPTFELTGGTKSLGIELSAPINNDWFFGEFTLVNETDGTEYNFTKEIEYYQGYEDGASWTEGSKNGEAFLSQIPEGNYHLNIYPEFSATNPYFSVIVVRDVPMYANFFITCAGLLLFPLIFFIRKHNREKRRWSDSEYSPYATE